MPRWPPCYCTNVCSIVRNSDTVLHWPIYFYSINLQCVVFTLPGCLLNVTQRFDCNVTCNLAMGNHSYCYEWVCMADLNNVYIYNRLFTFIILLNLLTLFSHLRPVISSFYLLLRTSIYFCQYHFQKVIHQNSSQYCFGIKHS